LEHPLGEEIAALLGAAAEDLEDELLLAHAGRARDVELLGDLGQLLGAHFLERRQVDLGLRRRLTRRLRRLGLRALRRLRLRSLRSALGLLRFLRYDRVSLAISVHS